MGKHAPPQGTRDFGPDVVHKRNYILNTIRNVFELYGFQPIETPAMENLDTLMGKYGDEGDKLIFKILNNGLDHADKQTQAREDFEKVLKGKNTSSLTERALKYDLTIPFARYVAMNHSKLVLPFKRYQIQPVWRADRPQRGRYREFYQCDADVVGSRSLLNEAELVNMYASVFAQLKVNVSIKLNSRKILQGLAEACGDAGKMSEITVAIDKLDKIGIDKVKEELGNRGLNGTQVETIERYLGITKQAGDNGLVLEGLNELLGHLQAAQEGINDLEVILGMVNEAGFTGKLVIDPSLARGLNYYTGTIFEVTADDVKIGSIGGGGRYDDLTGLFGVPGIPGVGISFGVDRIYDVMEEMNLFPEAVHTATQVLFFNLGERESRAAFGLMQQLRANGIRSELFHEAAKFDKQFKYAEKKNIPFIIIIGEKELAEGNCNIKNLATGKQETIAMDQLTTYHF